MDKIVVKIIHPHSHHPVIKTFNQTKLRIGRGFDNDLILDDSHISESHVHVRLEDGKFVLEDQESLNGVIDARTKERIDHQTIESGREVIMGSTKVIFYLPDHQVKPAKSFQKSHWFVKYMNKPLFAIMSFLVVALLALAESYLTDFEAQKWLHWVTSVLITTAVVFAWAGGWSFTTYLLRRRTYFVLHLGTVCFYFSIYYVVRATLSVLVFNLGFGGLYFTLEYVAHSIVCFLLLIRTLRVASRMNPKRVAIFSLVIAVVLNVFIYPISDAYKAKHIKKKPHYTGLLYSKSFKVMPSKSLEEWIEQSR